eukprot:gene5100-5193_t
MLLRTILALVATTTVSGCSVDLTRQISQSHPCLDNKTFGCFNGNNSMWATDGCMGIFECNGADGISCESHL